jgi:glutamyl-tRNA reductase
MPSAATLAAELDDRSISGLDGSEVPSEFLEPPALCLTVFEASLRTTGIDGLEALARVLDSRWLRERFARSPATQEATLVATCCRREVVLLTATPEEAARWETDLPGPAILWRAHADREAARHLFRVAGGHESVVVGEKEVRQQVVAAARGTLSRHPRRLVGSLLTEAVRAADQRAPDVPASRSIAAVAATCVLELVGQPFPRVLIVGAGAAGRQTAELLAPSARVTIAYRQRPPSEAFLRTCGARAVRADALVAEAAVSDAVVTAAKTGDRCLRPADLAPGRPLVLVDLGVPRNVDPSVRAIPGVRLVDVEDLRGHAPPVSDGSAERDLVEDAARAYERFERLALEPWVALARRRAEELRAAELGVARRHLGRLTPEQEVAVERLTRRLVQRLLLGPTERLREIPAGEDGDRLRRFALELLRPDISAP